MDRCAPIHALVGAIMILYRWAKRHNISPVAIKEPEPLNNMSNTLEALEKYITRNRFKLDIDVLSMFSIHGKDEK